MIRLTLLFSLLAAPVAAQTALNERPGRWISIPRAEAPILEAPVAVAPILEAADSAPLITADPSPTFDLTTPDVTDAAVLIAPTRVVPETRPVPRPRSRVVEVAAVAPVIEEVMAEAVPVTPPVAPIEVATAPAPNVPSTRPIPRPDTEATVALAEALAAQIAAEALAIMVAAPRDVPTIEGIAPEDTLAPVQLVEIPEVAEPTAITVPVRVAGAPSVVPMLTTALAASAPTVMPASMSAVLLPARVTGSRPTVQPVAFIMPPLETTPILPRLRPTGPAAMEGVTPLTTSRTAPLSAALLPSVAVQSTPRPFLGRSVAPSYDPFPLSALPPGDLPSGPESLRRAIQPPHPFAESNAAVLTGQPMVIPARLPVLLPPATPAFEAPVTDPDAPVELPAPDPGAVARMIDDATICWRLADLSPEAHWARVSVDVALDETNMPAGGSIRLTGFAHVVSGAAEDAYRAAHAALMGCAEATTSEPATTSTTLVFDRSGVRLQ